MDEATESGEEIRIVIVEPGVVRLRLRADPL